MHLRSLFEREYPALIRFLHRRLGDLDLAEDLAQEAFVRLIDHQPRDPRAWLFVVAANLARDAARSSVRRKRRLALLTREQEDEVGPPPDSNVLRLEERDAIRAALSSLSDRDRTLLLLHEEGMSYRQLAAVIGVGVESVGPLVTRARRRFLRAYEAGHRGGQDEVRNSAHG